MIIPEDLYHLIRGSMPIPCVDLVVSNSDMKILLVKRANAPAAGHWWFPGGRIHYGETRFVAAARKLKNECGLEFAAAQELGTFDLMFEDALGSVRYHSISTLFHVKAKDGEVRLDHTSEQFAWRSSIEWMQVTLHPFVQNGLRLVLENPRLLTKEDSNHAC